MNCHTYPLFYIDFEYLNINIQFIVLFCFFLIYISILLSQSHMKLKWLNILFGPESDLQNKIKNLFNSIIKKKKTIGLHIIFGKIWVIFRSSIWKHLYNLRIDLVVFPNQISMTWKNELITTSYFRKLWGRRWRRGRKILTPLTSS
jgi:hypothetical protein